MSHVSRAAFRLVCQITLNWQRSLHPVCTRIGYRRRCRTELYPAGHWWTNWTKAASVLDMKPVKIHEAKTQFSKLIGQVEAGDEIVVQRGDKPVAKIVPFDSGSTRTFGSLKGSIDFADDFDEIPEGFEDYV